MDNGFILNQPKKKQGVDESQFGVSASAQPQKQESSGFSGEQEKLASWLDTFQDNSYEYQYKPNSIADQINALPNSEKLSPVERWIYGKLPGFAQSSVGKALVAFSESPAGKVLGWLDVPAEGLERTLGFVAQMRDLQPGEEFRWKDAWAAGSLFYDVAKLPRLQYDEFGRATSIRVDDTAPGAYALTEARRLLEAGHTLEEVRETLYGNMGALAIRAQLRDTLGHIAIDPLNFLIGWLKPVQRIHAIRHLALTGKMDVAAIKVLEAEAKLAGHLDDAATFAKAIQKAEETGKAMTRLDRFAIALTGGTPWLTDVKQMTKGQKLLSKLNPFSLTPQSRASELLDIVAANVGEQLIRPHWQDDPLDFIKTVQAAARGSIGSEWGHLASTVQGRTVQGILSNSDAVLKTLGKEWDVYQAERALLAKLAEAMPGHDERSLWNLAKNSPEALWKELARASEDPLNVNLLAAMQRGEITPDVLKRIGAISNDVPLLREEFYTKALVGIQDIAMRQSILQFGITQKGIITKWSDALKAWETLPFIKANPANAIRNVVNNDITLVGRGLFGTMTGAQIDNFWKGKWIPRQFQRGFGLAGDELHLMDAFDPGTATKELMKIVEGKQSLPDKIAAAARGIDLKALDFSKFSAKMELRASKRAATMGWIEFHRQYWNPRTGFTSFTKHVDPQTLDTMEKMFPGISSTLDDLAQSSGADSAKFAELMQSSIEHNPTTIFKNTADRLGFDLDQTLGPEIMHTLAEGLPEAIKKGKVRDFVSGVRNQMEAHVDDLFNQHVENLPGIVAAQVKAGGPLQYHRVFGKAIDELWGGNVEHSIRMSTINEVVDYAKSTKNWKKVDELWGRILEDSEKHFGRTWKKFEAYQKGLEEGAKQAGIKYPKEVSSSFQSVKKGWDDFFKFRNEEYSKFFKSGGDGAGFDQVRGQVDRMYRDIVKEEDRLYQRIDDLMARSLPDKIQREMYTNFRDMAAKLRVADREKTIEFFEKLYKATPDDAPDMWQQYWTERMQRVEQMRQLDMRGSAAIQGDINSTPLFLGKTRGGEEPVTNVFDLANRYGISSATKTGARNDRRILNTVNKYAEGEEIKLATGVNAENLQPGQTFKLYRGEGKNIQGPEPGGEFWTTNRTKAEKYGQVKEVVVRSEDIGGHYAMGHGGKDEFVFPTKQPTELSTVKNIKQKYTKVSDIPVDVAQQAFERRAAAELESIPGQEAGFIPDAEKLFPDPLPLETGLSELNYGRSYAAMDALVDEATTQTSKTSRLFKDLPEEMQNKVNQWMKSVDGEMGSFRAAGVQYAAFRRDSALLNYNRRSNFDSWLGNAAPFAFWTTHSVMNWAIHSIDRPAMLTTYFRTRKFFETAGLPDQKVPARLKGNIRVPLPFTPPWMGDTFINPVRFLLPFDGFMMPWEQSHNAQFRAEGKMENTLNKMLEEGKISEEQYNEAVQNESGIAYDMAKSEVDAGGDNYDAMDFAQMMMTPHAPLMWGYNALRGTPNEIGPFTPLSRTTRNVATMMGVDDWQNSKYNVEGRIRKWMGLPAYDRWDDYRIGRSISNMAAENKYDMKDIDAAMQVAALVEAGKMTPEEAKQFSAVYKEAVKRANQEFAGGLEGTILSAIGLPVRAYPEGEQAQRELGEQFSKAYDAYDRGDTEALTKFFEENPEYESRLALFKTPEERLQTFMVDNIWARWNEVPDVTQREMADQLGPAFQTYFLDKETRSYDTLSPLQMQVWLKLMGGKPVGTLTADQDVMVELNRLQLTDPSTAWRVQTFYDMRDTEYPGWYELQNKYYALPESKRQQFTRQNPQLKGYWDARRGWMENNPDLVRFLTDDQKQLKKYEKIRREPDEAVPTAREIAANFSPEAQELLAGWTYGETLPPSMDKYLSDLAAQYKITTRQLAGILTGK